jgi:hypothetical protein
MDYTLEETLEIEATFGVANYDETSVVPLIKWRWN